MSRNHLGVATVVLVGLALSAAPLSADQDRRPEARERRGGGGRDADRPRGEARGGERRAQPREQARVERRGDRNDDRGDRGGDRGNVRGRNRDDDRGGDGGRDRYVDRGRDRDRGRDYGIARRSDPRWDDRRPRVVRPTVVVPRYAPSYRDRPRRVYVTPYGYRPRGYRSGWNASLYFGRPYGRSYYDGANYGYYAVQPGFAYGSLRIIDAPRDAQVFVDGYYAGVVDDYDGIFQHLNLEPGPHHIEIEIDPDAPLIEFDVRIVPGDTVTYRAVLPY